MQEPIKQEDKLSKSSTRRRRSSTMKSLTSAAVSNPSNVSSAHNKGGNPRIMPLKPEYTETDELFIKFIAPRFADLEDIYTTREDFINAFDRYQLLCGRSPQARTEQLIRELVEIKRTYPGLELDYIVKKVSELENILS